MGGRAGGGQRHCAAPCSLCAPEQPGRCLDVSFEVAASHCELTPACLCAARHSCVNGMPDPVDEMSCDG